jgi:hypothetical protein
MHNPQGLVIRSSFEQVRIVSRDISRRTAPLAPIPISKIVRSQMRLVVTRHAARNRCLGDRDKLFRMRSI